jgi:hypothetical protein
MPQYSRAHLALSLTVQTTSPTSERLPDIRIVVVRRQRV